MLGNDSLPRRPRSSRALEDFLDPNNSGGILEAEADQVLGDKKRTTQPNRNSTVVVGSSTGGNNALGSTTNTTTRSASGRRSPPDQQQPKSSNTRRTSQSPSGGIRRRKVSKSPSSASNDSSRGGGGGSSPSQQQHPMRSPRSSKYRRSPPLQRSPGYKSPSKKNSPSKAGGGKSPRRSKGGSGGGRGYLSSDARKRLDSSFPDLGGISSNDGSSSNIDATPTPLTGGSSSNNVNDKILMPQQQRSEDEEQDESLPGLIDDSIVREDFKGNRGGKQWNILEDTPGGHAPEKLVIVSGIENIYLEEDDIIDDDDDDDEFLPEDEDIVDDSLQIGDYANSTTSQSSGDNNKNRRQSLPNDIPTSMVAAASASNNGTEIHKSASAENFRDRFDPAFKNSDMWATDDEQEIKIVSRSLRSGSVSMLSDNIGGDVDTVSELGFHSSGFFDDRTYTNSVVDNDDEDVSQSQQQLLHQHRIMQGDGDSKNSSSIDISRTPATAKMSGGRHYNIAKMERAPNLSSSLPSSTNNKQYNDFEEELNNSFNHRAAVPEDAPLSASKRKSSARRKKKSSPTTDNTTAAAGTKIQYGLKDGGNNSSGRSSSNRRSVHTNTKSGSRKSRTAAGMEINANANAMRGSKRGQHLSRVPDVVPSTPVREIHSWKRCSPMSSSLTSTPSSLVSSMQQQQQNSALQHLRIHKQRRKNKPLQLHVGREHSSSDRRDTEDDHTLGASTITTNFSTTNRTRGDNTVSTRSLFRSEQMSHSETLKIPQRKKDVDLESEYETSDPQDDHSAASIIDEVEELHDSAKIEGKVGEDLDESAGYVGNQDISEILEGTIQPPEGTFKTMLRRPSGEGDDLLNSFDLISDDEKDSEDDADGAAGSNDDGSNASDFVRWQKENANLMPPEFTSDSKNCLDKKIANGFLELSIDNTGLHVEKTKIAEVAEISSSPSSGGTEKDTSTQLDGKPTDNHSVTKVQTSSSASATIKPRPRMIKHLSLAKLDENGVAHFKVPGIPHMRQKNGEVTQVPDDPLGNFGKKKKSRGGRLGLFKRVKSWKGVVALKDDDED